MIKTCKDWENSLDQNYVNQLAPEAWSLTYDAFEAGQQAQQAKIDELQGLIDEALSRINGITRFIDEDNPRDVHALSVTVDCELSRILYILKGNKDEN